MQGETEAVSVTTKFPRGAKVSLVQGKEANQVVVAKFGREATEADPIGFGEETNRHPSPLSLVFLHHMGVGEIEIDGGGSEPVMAQYLLYGS